MRRGYKRIKEGHKRGTDRKGKETREERKLERIENIERIGEERKG